MQKTAYEMRISDWSSDVCSSDLLSALIAEARAAKSFDVFLRTVPYFRFLGLTMREDKDGALLCVLPADPNMIGNARLPALPAGVVGALLESAAIVQLIWAAETDAIAKIIVLHVHHLRPSRPVQTFWAASLPKHGPHIHKL